MFKRILVPVDLSKKNARALAAAQDLGAHHGARVTLIHVIRPIPHIRADELDAFYSSLEERTREVLEKHVDRLRRAGIDATGVVAYGEPVKEVLDTARRVKAQVIVVNSHRVSATRPFEDWGGLSHKLAVLAPCPVLLVK